MSVTTIADARAAREPHLSGTARCLHCGHEHVSVSPVGVVTDLECPQCGFLKAVMVGLCAPEEGVMRWACNCGCQTFYITKQRILCVHCGLAQKVSACTRNC